MLVGSLLCWLAQDIDDLEFIFKILNTAYKERDVIINVNKSIIVIAINIDQRFIINIKNILELRKFKT